MQVWTDNSELAVGGWQHVFITSNWYCFRDTTGQGDYDLSHVDNDAMDHGARKLADHDGPILLDIECFDLAADFEHAVTNLAQAVCRWKSARPERLIGLYEIMPRRDFWSPVHPHITTSVPSEWERTKYERQVAVCEAWQQHNDRVAERLVGYVDFMCPSVYAFQPKYDAYWPTYAIANIREAQRIARGKPVVPIHWPKYHSVGDSMTLAQWKRHAEIIATTGVDTMIAYAPDGVQLPTGWDSVLRQVQVTT